MNKPIITFLILLIALSSCKPKPTDFWSSPDAYLGQNPPNDTPKIFAPGILAEKGAWAGDRVAISPDGKEFYYSHNTTWFSGKNLEVKYLKYVNGKWNGPFVLNKHYYAPTFSPDGKTLYFIGGTNKSPGDVVWQAHRTDTGWSNPAKYIRKPYGLYDFMPTQSGNMYAGSNGMQGDIRNFQTYTFSEIKVLNGDTTVQSLGVPVNSPGFNGDFFIAPDESYMIISNKERPDYECELAISFHKSDGSWTNPKSLGPLVNNDIGHRWGEYVSPDGKYLFYTHGHSEKDCFIYWVRFDALKERLKHTNFEPYVKNQLINQSAKVGRPFLFQIPGDTFMDDDGNNTLIYSAILSDGQPLPSPLKFDPATMKISGIPAVPGIYNIKVTATDAANTTASGNFILIVEKN
jgi:hypothetical protein